MKPVDQREEIFFGEALKRPSGSSRDAFLDAICLGDPSLRARLEALIQAHEGSQSLSEAKPETTEVQTLVLPPEEGPGAQIGRYRILEKIGEGGFGAVYVAEQKEPVKRRVALKIIKLGMDTRQVVARFEAERQALALMDHPNIAKVLDAGATETGRPFFVMELVKGIPITHYCEQEKTETTERLKLFIQVCHAIQHAHQKGIIHRDIKPSNILVTLHDGVAVPKVIDFGIAKATQAELTEKTVYTQFQQFIGTPAYMSPEQAEMSGLDIDTRADIYSLGVLLYELLTGSTPFDAKELMQSGLDEMRKIIREREPIRPSTRLRQTASHPASSVPLSTAISTLSTDLDWIVMKCLEKDRTRRYETASGLAMDLDRHLLHEPVMARPPSASYRAQKFIRRNKGVVVAVGLVAAALVLGTLVSSWQAVRASRAKQQANAEAERAGAEAVRALQAEKKAKAAEEQAITGHDHQRRLAYAADMNLASQALSQNNLGRALNLLNRYRPGHGERDLRSWEWRYLWKQSRSDELCLISQSGEPTVSLAVSGDGRCLAVGGYRTGRLQVYDLRTRQRIAVLPAGQPAVRAAFSPREPLLAFGVTTNYGSTNRQQFVRLWDERTRETVGDLPLSGECVGIVFSEDGQTLVAASDGSPGKITRWNVAKRSCLATNIVKELSNGMPQWPFAVSRDLRLAACISWTVQGSVLSLWDLPRGNLCWTNVTTSAFITCAFSPDGKTLASAAGYSERVIQLWDVASGRLLRSLEGHRGYIMDLLFWPDGTKLASTSADQIIRIWDVASGSSMATFRGNQDEVWRLALLPDRTTLVSGCKDGSVRLWDTGAIGRNVACRRLPSRLRAWCFEADSRSVLTVDLEGRVDRWRGPDFEEGQSLFQINTNLFLTALPFSKECFSPKDGLLASASSDGVVSIWDLQRLALVVEIRTGTDFVFPLEFLHHGTQLILLYYRDGSLHQWDLAGRQEMRWWPGVSKPSAVAFSPDERWCVVYGYDGATLMRDLTTGRTCNPNMDLGARGVTENIVFSPDGTLYAAASWGSVAVLWETATQRKVATLGRFLLGAHSVAFSPDGRRLAATSTGIETVKLWDLQSEQELLTLETPESRFVWSAFSPDGQVLGALSFGRFLHLWRAPSWEEIETAEKAAEGHAQ